MAPYKIMFKQIRKAISIVILVAFISTSVRSPAYAQWTSVDPMPYMPKPGVMVHLSPEYTPAYLKGIVIHPENALKFDFIIYKGDKALTDEQKREEYTKLTKYFLASLAIPDDDQWVNLSPYEKDRIIKGDFGKTEMGRDLLAQDYMLKQITASLIYPEDNLGKKFWDKVYTEAQEQYGTTNIPVNTFNKVWILPDDALIYEKGNTAYVLKNHLRVMLEEDYLSLQKHSGIQSAPMDNRTHTIASKIVREIVLPELQREVNEDKNFATVRQVYSGMLLATWYKRALKESLLSKIYANKSKVKGVDQDPKNNEEIYRQYLKAYKKGVFNFIKEDVDKYTNETIPRKYFSGGTGDYGMAARTFHEDPVHRIFNVSRAQEVEIEGNAPNVELAEMAADESVAAANAVVQIAQAGQATTTPTTDTAMKASDLNPGWTFTGEEIDLIPDNFKNQIANSLRIQGVNSQRTINRISSTLNAILRWFNGEDQKYRDDPLNELRQILELFSSIINNPEVSTKEEAEQQAERQINKAWSSYVGFGKSSYLITSVLRQAFAEYYSWKNGSEEQGPVTPQTPQLFDAIVKIYFESKGFRDMAMMTEQVKRELEGIVGHSNVSVNSSPDKKYKSDQDKEGVPIGLITTTYRIEPEGYNHESNPTFYTIKVVTGTVNVMNGDQNRLRITVEKQEGEGKEVQIIYKGDKYYDSSDAQAIIKKAIKEIKPENQSESEGLKELENELLWKWAALTVNSNPDKDNNGSPTGNITTTYTIHLSGYARVPGNERRYTIKVQNENGLRVVSIIKWKVTESGSYEIASSNGYVDDYSDGLIDVESIIQKVINDRAMTGEEFVSDGGSVERVFSSDVEAITLNFPKRGFFEIRRDPKTNQLYIPYNAVTGRRVDLTDGEKIIDGFVKINIVGDRVTLQDFTPNLKDNPEFTGRPQR